MRALLARNLHLLRGPRGSRASQAAHLVRRPSEAGTGTTLRVLTLNVRHARGWRPRPGRLRPADFEANARLIADFLTGAEADMVALQEADAPSTWSGSFHHVERFLDEAGYAEVAHGRHFRLDLTRWGLDYGTALLSRRPLRRIESRSYLARPLDTKGYVVAETELAGRPLDVASVHLDVVPSSRRRQVVETIRHLRVRNRPLVLMGDFNSTGRSRDGAVRKLARSLGLRPAEGDAAGTHPVRRPSRRLDWILVSDSLACGTCRHLDHSVSDHRAVVADISWRDGRS